MKANISPFAKRIIINLFGPYGQRLLNDISANEVTESAGIFNKFRHLVENIKVPTFAGFDYCSKSTGEVARRVVVIGGNYTNLVRKALETVSEVDCKELAGKLKIELAEVEKAKAELIESYNQTLRPGVENKFYRKSGQYETLAPGIKLNLNDGTLELQGVEQSKKVLTPGEYKEVKSRAKTIAKNAMRKLTRLNKYRSFSLDEGNALRFACKGESVEL
jgi:hypothetical protein